MNIKKDNNKSAFTLVELAIVLIIIGLITGGVVGAQSLIMSAKIRSEINNINRMKTAVQAFQLEFDAIPGDMKDAYDYFGSDCGVDNTSNTGCNGDGDKCIDFTSQHCYQGGSGIVGEHLKAQKHLVLSGIYPSLPYMETYTSPCVEGEHLPLTSIGNGLYFLQSTLPKKIFIRYADINIRAVCTMDGAGTGYITPKNARIIDRKIDDENGKQGLYQARYSITFNSGLGLHEGTDCMDSDGNYAVAETGTNCAIRYEIQ